MVENGVPELRGFAGFNEIYIHVSHFQDKIDKFSGDVEILQLICKIDLISLAIHELSHVKIRKVSINNKVRILRKYLQKILLSESKTFSIFPSPTATLTCTHQS